MDKQNPNPDEIKKQNQTLVHRTFRVYAGREPNKTYWDDDSITMINRFISAAQPLTGHSRALTYDEGRLIAQRLRYSLAYTNDLRLAYNWVVQIKLASTPG